MSQVSRRWLNPKLENRIYEAFFEALSKVKSKDNAKNFVLGILSDTERIMIGKRLAIGILLVAGYTYDEIDDRVKVTKGTIRRISSMIKRNKNFLKLLETLLDDELKLKESLKKTVGGSSPKMYKKTPVRTIYDYNKTII